MKQIVVLSLFLTVALQSTTAMASVCVPEAVNNPSVRGRASLVEFPDGRKITVVGHVHGERQIYDIMEKMESGALPSMSDEEFNTFLTKIVEANNTPYSVMATKEHREKVVQHFLQEFGVDVAGILQPSKGLDITGLSASSHAKEDQRFLRNLLSPGSSNMIEFIGYEGTYETWSRNFPYYKKARQELIRQYQLRVGRGKIRFSQSDIEDLLLSSSNANVYEYLVDPNLQKNVPMFGTESKSAVIEYGHVNPLVRMKEALQSVIAADEAYWDSKTKADEELFRSNPNNIAYLALLMHTYSEVMHMNISANDELEKFLKELESKAFPWIKSSVLKLSDSLRTRVKINASRDYESARSLVGRFQSGVHFVGLNHYKNTVSNLVQFCVAERDRSTGEYNKRQKAAH